MSSALAMSDSFIIRPKSQQTVVFLWNMVSGRAVWGSGGPRQSLSPFQAWCTSWNPDGLSYIRPFSLLTHTSTKLLLLYLNWNLVVPCTNLTSEKCKWNHCYYLSIILALCLCWGTPARAEISEAPSFRGCHMKVPPKDFDGFDSSHLWLWSTADGAMLE